MEIPTRAGRPPTVSTTRPRAKFDDPDLTATGEPRAFVPFIEARTIWFNTGTLCNIACTNCYIESSPANDRLVYIDRDDVVAYLDEIDELGWPVREIGFTGGEPFLNPAMADMAGACLDRGYEVLILTNAMRPMMRPTVQARLLELNAAHDKRLRLRISLDHFERERHDGERGLGSFDQTLDGLRWLRDNGFSMSVAGRTMWHEDEAESRKGFGRLFVDEALPIDAQDPAETVLFPEMHPDAEVPEITTGCWSILDKEPADVMCSESRMVVKRNGASQPAVVACTLIAYDERFELGTTLAQSARPVKLNHRFCAEFCVLGGGSCSA